MDAGEAMDLMREALRLTLILGAPVLLTALVVGLVVSILQALTQVQEYTLSFVPKMAAMLLAILVLGPWMLDRLVEFGRLMFEMPLP